MLKNYDRAIDDCNHAIELNPNHTNAFVGRGNARRYKGEYDLAIQDYDRAITLDAKNVNAILGRGLTYEYLKDYRRAVADYDQAIAIDPNRPTAWNNRCWVHAITNQLQTHSTTAIDLCACRRQTRTRTTAAASPI